jgi:hypothetical protein
VRLLRFGGPNGLQGVGEAAVYTLLVLPRRRLGEEALAATNLAPERQQPGLAAGGRTGNGGGHALWASNWAAIGRGWQRGHTSTASRAALVYTGLVALWRSSARRTCSSSAHASGLGASASTTCDK